MTEVLGILGGVGSIASVIALIVAVRWGMRAKDGEVTAIKATAAEQASHGETRGKLERSGFELGVTQKALAAANIRAKTLEEELAHALERSKLGDGLAPDDVGGRVLRIAGRWSEAAAARSPLPAEPTTAVSAQPTPEDPATAPVRRLDPIDVLR